MNPGLKRPGFFYLCNPLTCCIRKTTAYSSGFIFDGLPRLLLMAGFSYPVIAAPLYLLMDITIRSIQPTDNPTIAKIIRDTLVEFGANHPGTVYYDPTTDNLFELFQQEKSAYNILLLNDKIAGGGGIYPTDGLPADTCELVKMYLLPEARGTGLGSQLIVKCLEQAKANGFSNVYLETMDELKPALKAYERLGFQYLAGPMGNSGHFGCSLWMMKEI
jgi:putative acetyltransferase